MRMSNIRPRDYGYIDNVRFLSMIAIVLLHAGQVLFSSEAATLSERLILQFRTFGVPLLFVNSAFLMSDWLERHGNDVAEYWKSRFFRIAVPWGFWVTIYMALDSYKALLRHEKLAWIYHNELLRTVFFTPFWFVPILLFSLALMLPLRRYWNSGWLGLGTLLLTLVYSANLHMGWFPDSHTTAFLGYLFPVWIGIQLYRRLDAVSSWVGRLPGWVPIAALCATYFAAVYEYSSFPKPGYGSSALQISNLLYAFAVLLVLMRFPFRIAPTFIDARKDTYGIYLTHELVLMFTVGIFHLLVGEPIQAAIRTYGTASRISIWFLVTVFVFTGCLIVTRFLRSTSWAWTVGDGFRASDRRRPAQAKPAHTNF